MKTVLDVCHARRRQRWLSSFSLDLMRALILSLGLVAASAAASQLTDDQLRAQIVGVWYCEALRDTLHHNGGRLQYFPDGLFIADYRISSVASEQYVRTRGRWSVDHGVFTETADYVAGSDESIPKLARQVVAINRQKMVLAPAAGGGARFTIWRGKTRLNPSEHSMEATQKNLLAELEAVHMSGFRPTVRAPVLSHGDSTAERSKLQRRNET
jgi:hypothetical protein